MTSTDLPLWASVRPDDPTFLIVPSSELEHRFKAFHEKNAHIYRRIEEKAFELVGRGRIRIGIAEIVEELRYDAQVRSEGEAFKINNSYRAFYARLLVHRKPQIEGVIETRRQTHQVDRYAQDPDYRAGRGLK